MSRRARQPDAAGPETPDTEGARDTEAAERVVARAAGVLRQALAAPLAGGLYIVSTPIGNLADITLRALAVLARADIVLAEDTRHSRKLISHFGLAAELQPYHEHNAEAERPRILARLRAGHSVALIADAGTPLVSDPGYKLARAALEEGFAVTSVPGPSAALAALTSSGLPSDRFHFAGFLPPKREGRRNRLAELAATRATLILFEAPSRLVGLLKDAAEILGAREAAVAKELTKLHEAVLRGPLDEIAGRAADGFAEKGEFVVVVGPPQRTEVSDAEIEARLAEALQEMSVRDAAREVAEALGLHRGRVYRLALAMKGAGGHD